MKPRYTEGQKLLIKMAGYRAAIRAELHVRVTEKPTSWQARNEVARMLDQIHLEWRLERKDIGL